MIWLLTPHRRLQKYRLGCSLLHRQSACASTFQMSPKHRRWSLTRGKWLTMSQWSLKTIWLTSETVFMATNMESWAIFIAYTVCYWCRWTECSMELFRLGYLTTGRNPKTTHDVCLRYFLTRPDQESANSRRDVCSPNSKEPYFNWYDRKWWQVWFSLW